MTRDKMIAEKIKPTMAAVYSANLDTYEVDGRLYMHKDDLHPLEVQVVDGEVKYEERKNLRLNRNRSYITKEIFEDILKEKIAKSMPPELPDFGDQTLEALANFEMEDQKDPLEGLDRTIGSDDVKNLLRGHGNPDKAYKLLRYIQEKKPTGIAATPDLDRLAQSSYHYQV